MRMLSCTLAPLNPVRHATGACWLEQSEPPAAVSQHYLVCTAPCATNSTVTKSCLVKCKAAKLTMSASLPSPYMFVRRVRCPTAGLGGPDAGAEQPEGCAAASDAAAPPGAAARGLGRRRPAAAAGTPALRLSAWQLCCRSCFLCQLCCCCCCCLLVDVRSVCAAWRRLMARLVWCSPHARLLRAGVPCALRPV